MMQTENTVKSIKTRGQLKFFDRPQIMGILNITPDSFYDGGRYISSKAAKEQAGAMIREGADWIDVGACSSRPGAKLPDHETEWKRLAPVLKVLRDEWPELRISVDTFRAGIAKAAVEQYGADMINDISAGAMDGLMMPTVAGLGVPYVMMHMQGRPENMQEKPNYSDLVPELLRFFSQRLTEALEAGIDDLLIDPGFGFGKTADHNFELLAGLGAFAILERPLMVGLSRKSMVWRSLGISPEKSLNGTTALHMAALLNGADVLRVHDVGAARETAHLYRLLKSQSKGL
jgi:dihydropteroate synthase